MDIRPQVRFADIMDKGDQRGSSITLPEEIYAFLGTIADIHAATIVPGSFRGNHFHLRRREVLIIVHEGEWMLHWDEGENTPVQRRGFQGHGIQIILIEPGCSHAVQNLGSHQIAMFASSSLAYDPKETVSRSVIL